MSPAIREGFFATDSVGDDKPLVVLEAGDETAGESVVTLTAGLKEVTKTVAEWNDCDEDEATFECAYATDMDHGGITWMNHVGDGPAVKKWAEEHGVRTYTFPESRLKPRTGRWGA